MEQGQSRAEPPIGAEDFPEAGSKLTSFEDDILGDPEALTLVVQVNVAILPLNLVFVFHLCRFFSIA